MPNILSITSPVFILIGLGYLAVRSGLFPREGVRMLGIFVLYFALPALLFKSLSERDLSEIFNLTYLLGYGLGSVAVFVAMLLIGGRFRRRGLVKGSILALGSSVSNSGFIGYPILIQLLGPAAMVPFALTLMVENILMIPLALALAESGEDSETRFRTALLKAMGRLLRHPLIVSILLAIPFCAFQWSLPKPAASVVDMLAAASGSAALFVIGGSLVGVRLGGLFTDIFQVLFGKLLLHPLAVASAFLILPPVDPTYFVAAVVLACVPMSAIYPILGQKYGMESLCAAIMLAAVIVSFASTSLWIQGLVS